MSTSAITSSPAVLHSGSCECCSSQAHAVSCFLPERFDLPLESPFHCSLSVSLSLFRTARACTRERCQGRNGPPGGVPGAEWAAPDFCRRRRRRPLPLARRWVVFERMRSRAARAWAMSAARRPSDRVWWRFCMGTSLRGLWRAESRLRSRPRRGA